MNVRRSIEVWNEWGKLREAVVGIEDETVEPEYIPALIWLDEEGKRLCREVGGKRTAEILPEVVQGLREQLHNHVRILKEHGVVVHRTPPLGHPEEREYLGNIQQGNMLFGGADFFRVIGREVLLLNSFRMPFRRKQVFMVRPLLERLLEGTDARYAATPPPSPHYNPMDLYIENGDMMIDGKNVYVGLSGNATSPAGVEWLKRYLGSEYQVHVIRLKPDRFHLDWVFSLNRPGLLTFAPSAMEGELPEPLKSWDKIEVFPEEVAGANNLSLDEHTILMAEQYERIAEEYTRRGMEVILEPLDLTIAYGSGSRCLTAVLRRDP